MNANSKLVKNKSTKMGRFITWWYGKFKPKVSRTPMSDTVEDTGTEES